jgi:hypothetical protein
MPRRGEAKRNVGDCLVLKMLSLVVLAILLVTGRVEQNPGPLAEGEMAVQLLCTGCGRNLNRKFSVNCANVGFIIVAEM